MIKTIAIDFGHGTGQDRGAVGYLNEEITVREFGPLIIEGLKKRGIIVYDVTPKQAGLTLAQSLAYRVNMANNYKVDLFVSLHLNAFNAKAHGCEIEYTSTTGKAHADKICMEISKLGFENRGSKVRENLYVLKYTKMPAILIESFFCDNKNDCSLYNKQKLAAAIINGILGDVAVENIKSENKDKVTFRQLEVLQGEDVKLMQNILYKLKLLYHLTAFYDMETREAIVNYQKSHSKLKVTGIVDKDTWESLMVHNK